MREPIEVNGVCYDNLSLNKKVGFIEDIHKYVMIDKPELEFTSVTTLIKEYKEPFDSQAIADKVSKNANSKYYGMSVEDIVRQWDQTAIDGTHLHAVGEECLHGKSVGQEDLDTYKKAKFIEPIVQELWDQGYKLATTELLTYSEKLKVAGQSDILLKKYYKGLGGYSYQIFDWKFMSKKIERKSMFDRKTWSFKMMTGIFRELYDCKYMHYSVQLAIYQALSGAADRIDQKVLVCVYDDSYELLPCWPIKIFWNVVDGEYTMQSIYMTYDGRWFDSRTGRKTITKPKVTGLV